MKRYNIRTRVIVDFDMTDLPKPLYFLGKGGERIKINSISSCDMARWAFRDVVRYCCNCDKMRVELMWDRHLDRWYLSKQEAI